MEQQEQPQMRNTPKVHTERHGLVILVFVLVIVLTLVVILYFSKKSATEQETFDPQAQATGVLVDDALQEIYSRSGTIAEIADAYIILQSDSVKEGQIYTQRFKVLLTKDTRYTERTFSMESTEKIETPLQRSALAVGDEIRANASENIVAADVFTATEIQRYQQIHNSEQ